MGDDPRKRVERGGVGTKEWLLKPQAQAPVYAPEDLTWIQGAKAGGINQFEFGEPGVVATPAGARIPDHMESPLGGGLESPPEPKQKDPKRRRGESEEKAPDPKAARTASSQREASRAADPLLRVKTPPPAVPAKADAQAKAKSFQEILAMPSEQLLDEHAQLRNKGRGRRIRNW